MKGLIRAKMKEVKGKAKEVKLGEKVVTKVKAMKAKAKGKY